MLPQFLKLTKAYTLDSLLVFDRKHLKFNILKSARLSADLLACKRISLAIIYAYLNSSLNLNVSFVSLKH